MGCFCPNPFRRQALSCCLLSVHISRTHIIQQACLLQEVVDDPTGNKMLLVMDYMEGGPVMTRDALEKGRCIPEPLALQYFRDMCKVSLSELLLSYPW